jgi:hypothetical protein
MKRIVLAAITCLSLSSPCRPCRRRTHPPTTPGAIIAPAIAVTIATGVALATRVSAAIGLSTSARSRRARPLSCSPSRTAC